MADSKPKIGDWLDAPEGAPLPRFENDDQIGSFLDTPDEQTPKAVPQQTVADWLDKPEDTWAQLGAKVLKQAPAIMEQTGAGVQQIMAERPVSTLATSVMPMAAKTPVGAAAAIGDVYFNKARDWLREKAGMAPEDSAKVAADLFASTQADIEANAPNVEPDSLKDYAVMGAQSFIQMIPGLIAGFATKSPEIGAATMAIPLGGQRYSQSRAEGRTPAQAGVDAQVTTLAEGLPEMIPLGVMMRPGRKFLERTLKTMGWGGASEVLTQLIEDGYSTGALDEGMTWGQALSNMKKAGILGVATEGAAAVVTHPFAPHETESGGPPPAADAAAAPATPTAGAGGQPSSPAAAATIPTGPWNLAPPPIAVNTRVGLRQADGPPEPVLIEGVQDGYVFFRREDGSQDAAREGEFRRDLTAAPPPSRPNQPDATTVPTAPREGEPPPSEIGDINDFDPYAMVEPKKGRPAAQPSPQGAMALPETKQIQTLRDAASAHLKLAAEAERSGQRPPEWIASMKVQAAKLMDEAAEVERRITPSRTAPDATAATPEQMAARRLGTLGTAAPAISEATTGPRSYPVTPKAAPVIAQPSLEPIAGSEAEVPQPIAQRPGAKPWQQRLREQIGSKKASINDPVAMARNLGTTPENVTAELRSITAGRNAPIRIMRGTVTIDPKTKQPVQSARAGKYQYTPTPTGNVKESLSDFVYNNGGIAPTKTFAGELEARDLHTAKRPFKGNLVKPAARMTVEQMADHALQSGFQIPTDNTGQHADTDAFLNMLEQDHGAGRKHYRLGEEPETEGAPAPMTPAQRKRAAINQLTALGFEPRGNTHVELENQLDTIIDAAGDSPAQERLGLARAAERTGADAMDQDAQDALRQEVSNDYPDQYDDEWHRQEVAEGIPPTQYEADARLSEGDQQAGTQPQGEEPASAGTENTTETAPEGGNATQRNTDGASPIVGFTNQTAEVVDKVRSINDAASWARQQGSATGFEHVIVLDGNGRPILAGTSDASDTTEFPLPESFRTVGMAVTAIHNHPISAALSSGDIGILGYPGVGFIVAISHDGKVSAAIIGRNVKTPDSVPEMNKLRRFLGGLYNNLDRYFSATEANPFNRQELVMRTLGASGIIEYHTSHAINGDAVSDISRAASMLRKDIKDAGLFRSDTAGLPLHRPTFYRNADRALAAISQQHGEIASRRRLNPLRVLGTPSDTGQTNRNQAATTASTASDATGNESANGPAGEEARRGTEEASTGGVLARLLDDESGALTLPDWEKIKAYFGIGKKARTAREAALEGVRMNIGQPDTLSRMGKMARYLRSAVSLAAIDKPSSVYWNAFLRRDHVRATLEREAIQQVQPYLALDQAARDRINKVAEHDRLYGVDRKATGRDVVVKIPDRKVPFGQAKPELTKPGEIVALDTAETKALFALRKFFDSRLNQMGEAMAIERGYKGKFDRASIQAAIDAAGSPRERKPAQAALEILDRTEEMRRNGYVPFQRYGDTYIVVKPKVPASGTPETAWFELVDTKSMLDKVFSRQGAAPRRPLIDKLAELKKRFPADQFDYQVGVSTPKALAELNIPAIERAFAALNAKQGPGTAQIIDGLLHEIYESRKAGLRKQAENVPGYSLDFERAITDYVRQTSAIIARMSARNEIDSAYDATQAHPVKEVRDFWKRHKDHVESEGDDYAGLRKLGFFMFLWGSPASAAINLTQTPLVTQMQLGTWAGIRAPGLAHGAMLEGLGAIRIGRNGLELNFDKVGKTDAEKAMIKTLRDEGRLDPSISLSEFQGGRFSTKRKALRPHLDRLQRAYDIGASAFNVTETVNRIAAALAYFRAAQNPQLRDKMRAIYGQDENFKEMVARRGMDPVDIARYGVDETQFIGGKINRPEAMRGWGAVLLQFKTYIANYLRLLHKNFARMGPQGKLAGSLMLGSMLAISGLFGVPFGDDALKAADFIGEQINGIDPNLEFQLRQMIADAGFGEYGAEVMTRGFGRNVFGADVGGRIGMGNIFPDDSITSLAPLATGTIGRVSEALDRYHTGQPLGAIGALAGFLGKGTQDVVKGTVVYPNEGASTKRGNITVAPGDLTRSDMLLRSLGFQPTDVARAGEQQYQAGRIANATQGARTAMLTQIARLVVSTMDARQAGDTDGAAEYSHQIEELYRRNAAQMLLDDVPDWQKIPPAKRQAVRQRVLSLIRPEIANIRRAGKLSRPTLMNSPFVQP